MKLFVDVDDTLVRWIGPLAELDGPHPLGGGAERWEWNADVLSYVINWRITHPDGQVFVWSGGGVEYAATWTDRAIRAGVLAAPIYIIPKEPRLPMPGDTFIDDMPWASFKSACLDPRSLKLEASA